MPILGLRARNSGHLVALNADAIADVTAYFDAEEDSTVKAPSEIYLSVRLMGETHYTRYVTIDADGQEAPQINDTDYAIRQFLKAVRYSSPNFSGK